MREIHCQGDALEQDTEDSIAEMSQFILLIMHSLGAAQRQSREREAFVWQQHPRALTGIQEELCMPGEKSRFPNSFYPLSAETTHGRAAAPQLQTSDSGTLCPSLRVPHRAAPLPGKSAPQNTTPQTPCPSSQAGQKGITSCTAGPGASPAPAQADPGLKPVGSTVCSTLVLMSFLWWWPWMQPPGHQRNLWPLTAVLISVQSLPRACLLLPSLGS